ncbi:MAG: ABC transporter permease [Deinococcales bacterium]
MSTASFSTDTREGMAPVAKSRMQVAWEQFRKHQLAVFGGMILFAMYVGAIFAPFIGPYGLAEYSTTNITRFHPPTQVHFFDEGRLTAPFVYATKQELDMQTFAQTYVTQKDIKCPVRFFVSRPDQPYHLFFLIPANIRLFGVDKPCNIFLMGADLYGRDVFTRLWYGAAVSLTIGIFAVALSTILGLIFGGLAGYYGGWIDNLIMRLIEVIGAIPGLFLLLTLTSVLPQDIDPLLVFYSIIFLLGVIGWGGLARTVRSQISALRESDMVQAAVSLGAKEARVIAVHMLPITFSLLIVGLSLGIPGAILAESGLSFLGRGIREPYSSWGSMINQAQEGGFASIAYRPWMLIPGFFIVIAVLCWQFLGDGLRDALDPRKRQ